MMLFAPTSARHLFLFFRTVAIGLITTLSLSHTAAANPYEYTLENGLHLIVKEDHRAPTAVHMIWYKIGSIDEKNGTTGVSHLLEHMMFKGTPTYGPGEFNRIVAAAGGRDNAFTSRDYTAYYQQIPSNQLKTMMKLEADRMRHLSLTDESFSHEIQVVMEERRWRTDDEPLSVLGEQLNATAFQAHPYRVPVIGWMNDLENMTAEDARQWYDSWYEPSNATVVVVGDVKAEAVLALAKEYYGTLPKKAVPVRKPQIEPKQIGIRRITVKAPADLPALLMAYKAPTLTPSKTADLDKTTNNRDAYALEMLSAILDGHSSARFPRHLVKETQVAISASSDYDSISRGPGLFIIQATPRPGVSMSALEAALRAELQKITVSGINTEELERAKTQVIASETYKLDSMFAQALEIGQLETSGFSYQRNEEMIKALMQVTSADIQRVILQYFHDDTLTVAELSPQKLAPSNTKTSSHKTANNGRHKQ